MKTTTINLWMAACFLIAIGLSGCSDSDKGTNSSPTAPSVPSSVAAVGSHGQIVVSWAASSGGNLQGYDLYRSEDGATYTKINASLINGVSHTDTNVDDDVYYQYKLKAIGDAESAFSAVVRQMHGTRLVSSYASGLIVSAGAGNPYVVEGVVTIDDGDLVIDSGAAVYVLDNATIDMEVVDQSEFSQIEINGLFRIAAHPDTPATITAHRRSGGALNNGEGIRLRFLNDCVDFNPADSSGTLIQNVSINNIRYSSDAVFMQSCSPCFSNCYINSNQNTGGSYFEIEMGSWPIIEHCAFNQIVLKINVDLRGTDARIEHNVLRDGYYSIYFYNVGMVDAGQVENNDFDATTAGIYLFAMTAVTDVPLENNYWNGGTPTIIQGGSTTVTADIDPSLANAPAGCGPSW